MDAYKYVEVKGSPSCEKVAEDGEFTFGIYLTNCCCEDELEEAVLKWAWTDWTDSDEEEDINLTIRLRLRDVFKELYSCHSFNDGCTDEDSMPLFNALRKDCEWVIKQIDELKIGVME